MSIKSFGQLVAEVNKLKRERVAVEVDAAIRDGQLSIDQREWGIRCAAETPEHWRRFLAATPSPQLKVETEICSNLGLDRSKVAAAYGKREVFMGGHKVRFEKPMFVGIQ